jgi:hypothetical protein
MPKLTELRLVKLSADNSFEILPKENSPVSCGPRSSPGYSGAVFSLSLSLSLSLARERGKALGRIKSASSRDRSAMLREPDMPPRSGTFCRLIHPLKGHELERGRR